MPVLAALAHARRLRPYVISALVLAAPGCGGSMPPPPPMSTWTSGKPIFVDIDAIPPGADNVASTAGQLPAMRKALDDELRSIGFSPVAVRDAGAAVLAVKEIGRSHITADIIVNRLRVDTLTADASACTSAAWGVVGDRNVVCLARALVTILGQSSTTRVALSDVGPSASQARSSSAVQPASGASASASGAAPATFLAGAPQPTAYAVIVGVEKYDGLPAPTGARADAQRFGELARRSLGIPESHIRVTLDGKATKASIERDLQWAKSSVSAGGRLYFYYSGHGAPDASTGGSYIVPVDGDPKYLEQTAIPIAEVMKQLSASKAKEILVVLDSCFSGAGGRSVLPPGARPLVRVKEEAAAGQLALFSASSGAETSGPAADGSGGIFTLQLVEGLGTGSADMDGDGQVTLEELHGWVRPRVAREAKKDNRDQTPSLSVGRGLGSPGSFLVSWGLPSR